MMVMVVNGKQPEPTIFCRVPINSIYGFILGTCKITTSGWLGKLIAQNLSKQARRQWRYILLGSR